MPSTSTNILHASNSNAGPNPHSPETLDTTRKKRARGSTVVSRVGPKTRNFHKNYKDQNTPIQVLTGPPLDLISPFSSRNHPHVAFQKGKVVTGMHEANQISLAPTSHMTSHQNNSHLYKPRDINSQSSTLTTPNTTLTSYSLSLIQYVVSDQSPQQSSPLTTTTTPQPSSSTDHVLLSSHSQASCSIHYGRCDPTSSSTPSDPIVDRTWIEELFSLLYDRHK